MAVPVQAGLSPGCHLDSTAPASASGNYPEERKRKQAEISNTVLINMLSIEKIKCFIFALTPCFMMSLA